MGKDQVMSRQMQRSNVRRLSLFELDGIDLWQHGNQRVCIEKEASKPWGPMGEGRRGEAMNNPCLDRLYLCNLDVVHGPKKREETAVGM